MQRADTEGTQINAAEVSRVGSLLLDELAKSCNKIYEEGGYDEDVMSQLKSLLFPEEFNL